MYLRSNHFLVVSHMLHSDLFGEKEGTLGIKAEDVCVMFNS